MKKGTSAGWPSCGKRETAYRCPDDSIHGSLTRQERPCEPLTKDLAALELVRNRAQHLGLERHRARLERVVELCKEVTSLQYVRARVSW